jgi:hypothetical protein
MFVKVELVPDFGDRTHAVTPGERGYTSRSASAVRCDGRFLVVEDKGGPGVFSLDAVAGWAVYPSEREAATDGATSPDTPAPPHS